MLDDAPRPTPASPSKKSKKSMKNLLYPYLPAKSKPLIPETLFGTSSNHSAHTDIDSPAIDKSGESPILVCSKCHVCVHASKCTITDSYTLSPYSIFKKNYLSYSFDLKKLYSFWHSNKGNYFDFGCFIRKFRTV